MDGIAGTPEPPYYAVIFTARRTSKGAAEYAETAARMAQLASEQPGYLGLESARDADGLGVTVSYWESLDAVRAWRDQIEHRAAQRRGRADWYAAFSLRISRVESARHYDANA